MTTRLAGKKRIIAWITAAALLAVLILSLMFIVGHLKHECTGDDCPVCAEIKVCAATIRLITEAVGTAAAIIFIYIIIPCRPMAVPDGPKLRRASLVSLKVRLDD